MLTNIGCISIESGSTFRLVSLTIGKRPSDGNQIGNCNGNVVLCPMTGYELRAVADMSVMVVIEYVETPEQLESGERKTLQAILYVDQA